MNGRTTLRGMRSKAGLLLFILCCFGAVKSVAGGFAGLGEEAAGFAEVVPGHALEFPRDHGAHPEYRIEWWYVTANLKGADGADYGVQWTLFRQALGPSGARDGFASPQVWMGHAAVTTAQGHRFAETLARGGIGQAGADAAPFKAWIDDWSFASTADGSLSAATLSATARDFAYTLSLTTQQPLALQGDKGYSRKSERGQASYYYSQPFFSVSGTLDVGGRKIDVTGSAWMDREWSSQPLAADQKGWDWFSLHLPKGEKLMLFQLRSADGSAFRAGTWIGADGTVATLSPDDISLKPLERASVAGRSLPVAWKVEVKSRGLSIETTALNKESWMGTAFPYWEGPVRYAGTHAGVGYLEMTGY
jgi:predicted secreted hydrolase